MDRIEDAYNGLMGEKFMRQTRERLHWICSKCVGARILDVGCSQGTLDRLLGQLGKSVLGVDVDKDAIAYAEGKLAEMDGSSRERLSFVTTNFMDFKTKDRFDTVVMGEILEHLVAPELFVKKAFSLLVGGGTLVVTVPFGINDHPDHRQTFYCTWIKDFLEPFFCIKGVNFSGKWLGVVGVKRAKRTVVDKQVPVSFVRELETAFYALERPIVNENKVYGQRLQNQNKDIAETKKALATASSEVSAAKTDAAAQKTRVDKAIADCQKIKTDLSTEIAKQKDVVARLTAEKAAVEAAAAKQKTALVAEQAKVKDLNSKLVATRNELAATKNEALELRVNLDADRKVSSGQAEQISVLKAALQFAANRTQIETSDTRLIEYSQEVRELRSALEVKRDEIVERAEKVGMLSGRIDALNVEKEVLSSRVAELSAALEAKSSEVAKAEGLARQRETENAQLCREVALLKDQVREAAERIEKLGLLSDQVNVLTSQVDALKAENQSLSSKAAELSAALEARTQALENAENYARLCEEKNTRLSGVESELLSKVEALSVMERELESERGRLAAKIADLAVLFAAKSYEAEKAEARTKLCETENAMVESQLAVARQSAVAVQEERDEVARKCAVLENECSESRSACDSLRNSLKAMESRWKKADAAVRAAQSENRALNMARQKAAAAQKATAGSLQKQISELRRAYTELKKAKTVAVRRHNEKAQKLKDVLRKYKALSKSKLGRLTLGYWHLKDRLLCRTEKKPDDKQETKAPLPQQLSAVPSNRPVKAAATSENGSAPKDGSSKEDGSPKEDGLPKGDEGFFSRMAVNIAEMPVSNGSRYYEKINARIGLICDRFFYDAINAAADFVYIPPDVTEETLAGLDAMLVVSTWSGLNNDEWRGFANDGRPKRRRAEEIVETCRRYGVPTIFYSKEDPPNYEYYITLAQKCDCVFTSAAECIPDYKRDCGHDRVWTMKFCINPAMHNPVGMRHVAKERNVIFSGSWMAKYPHRCKDLETIFSGVLKSGRKLNIVDRNYALRSNPMYRYPEKYLGFQSPAIEHDALQKVHKCFDWAINVNTVKNSSTMFANRAYELQASGNLLLSNYSLGVSNLLPTVFLVHDADEAARILNSFTPEEVYERQVSGVRRVMTGETCFDRIAEMLELAGLHGRAVSQRNVLVVARKITGKVREMFERQSLAAKRLVSERDLTDSIWNSADIVAFFDDKAEYGVFYLEDMVNAFKYTNCDYVTKEAYLKRGKLVAGREHDFVSVMPDKYRTVFWRRSFGRNQLVKLRRKAKLPNGYSIDHFNFEVKPCRRAAEKPEISVILPTYNNGWFLYGRSFASLRRSSLFQKMEVLIVDDGSPDMFTPKMGQYLESLYPNVRTYCFPTGGSGTGARSRNKGVELARGKYIVYLDPDDEAIGDGYAKLYAAAEEDPSLDFVIGNMLKLGVDGKMAFVDNVCHITNSIGTEWTSDVR